MTFYFQALRYSDTNSSTVYNATGGDIYGVAEGYEPWGTPALDFGNGDAEDSFLGYWYEIPGYYQIGFSPAPRESLYLNNGLDFNAKKNQIRPESYKDKILSVCPWVPKYCSPSDCIVTLEYGMMWRDSNSTRNSTCADVHLKAVFPNETLSY